jgi:hypothetical protein
MKAVFILLLVPICSVLATEKKQNYFNYERKVEVPEPMFIDLVRSLDSVKGELEFNSLFADYNSKSSKFKWAPEVEYAFTNGQALELEFPGQGSELKNYKIAYQKNITSLKKENCLQGFQLIYESNKEFSESESTLYHIYALRLNHHISFMNIAGIKLDNKNLDRRSISWNSTFFYNYTEEVDFGLEVNLETAELGNKMYQFIPQVHLALKNGYKIQYGFGTSKIEDNHSLLTSFRLIKEFNL